MFRQATAWDGLPGPAMAERLASLTTLPGDFDEPACTVHPADGGPAVLTEGRDLADLPDADLIEVLAASEAQAAWTAAQQLLVLAEFDRRQPPPEAEFSADQIAPAVTWTRLTAQARLDLAKMACGQYPDLLDGMLEGVISLAKAQIICDQTSGLDDAVTAEVMAAVLPHVPGWTTGQLRHRLARIIVAADPQGARQRAERAKKGRDVFLRQGEDGNAILQALLDAYDAAAAFEIIDRAAHIAATPGDTRNLGQRRSDVLLDLILGRTTTSPASAEPGAGPGAEPASGDRDRADGTDGTATGRAASASPPSEDGQTCGGSEPAAPAGSHPSPERPSSQPAPSGPPVRSSTAGSSAGSPSKPPPEPAACPPPATQAQAATHPATTAPNQTGSADPGTSADPITPDPITPANPMTPAPAPAGGQLAAGPRPAGPAGTGQPAGPPRQAGQPAGQDRGASVGSIINVVILFSTLAALLPGCLPTTTTATTMAARAGRAACELPGWIEGLGVTAASSIRDLITDLLNGARGTSTRTGWRVIACTDDTGAPHAISHTRYRPPPALQELVKLRDRTCRFPGCRQPAARCDLDHAIPFDDGGPTCDCDLHCLCRHHHRLKQHPGWTVHLSHGTSTWTSPTGHTYTSTPHPDWTDPSPTPDWAQNPSPSSNTPNSSSGTRTGTDTRTGTGTGTGTTVSGDTRKRNPSLPAQPAEDPDDTDEATSRWNPLTPENVAWLGRTQPPAGNTGTPPKTSRQPCTAYAPDTTPGHIHDGRCLGTDPPY